MERSGRARKHALAQSFGLPKRKNAIKKEYNIWTVPVIIVLNEEVKVVLSTINDLPLIIQKIDKKKLHLRLRRCS